MTISPKHEQKRANLNMLGAILLALGVPLLLFGLYSFGSNFFTSNEEFFANPDAVMDQSARSGVIGMVGIALGGLLSGLGARILFFGNAGKIARYAAGEFTPVVRDVGQSLAPTIGEIARQARGTGGGIECATCNTSNDAGASFCDGCGAKLAKTCSRCGEKNDAKAAFCDQCGGPVG